MEAIHSNFRGIQEKVISEGMMNQGLMSLMSQQQFSSEEFYLTGYETITFNRSRYFALETVLNSTVPFEKDLLILTNGDVNDEILSLCELHGINTMIISFPNTTKEWDDFDALVSGFSRFSHVLFSCEESDCTTIDQLKKLSTRINKKRAGLIVNCNSDSIQLSDVKNADIDYLVYNGTGCSITSVVLARRSKLVQTEGISRSYTHNLYAFWQKAMSRRKSIIKPMIF